MTTEARRYYRARWWEYLTVLGIGLAEAGALVGLTLNLRDVTEQMIRPALGGHSDERYRAALRRVAVLAAIAVGLGLLRFLEFGVTERAGYYAVRKLRMAMYHHLQGMTPDQIRFRARGGLFLRLTGDLSMLRMFLSRGQLLGVPAALSLFAGIGVIAWLNVWMGVAVLLGACLTGAVSLMAGRSMRASTRAMRRRRSALMSNVVEQLNCLPVVQTGGRLRGEYVRLSRQNDRLTLWLNRVAWLRAVLRGLAYAGSLLLTILVLAVGLAEVRSHATTIGALVAALITVRFLSRPLRVLGLAHDYWHRGQVSRQKVEEFFQSSSRGFDRPELERLRVRRGLVEFEDVSVGPLSRLRLTAEPGQLVAITGPMGAGKSTILRALARLADLDGGRILIDDQDIATLNPLSVVRLIGYASPDLPLMRGTVRRNLTYHERLTPPEEVQRIAFALGLESVLADIPLGLDGWLTESGANLSVGQRQLIAIGRAAVANPPLLLLDEPMAGLDAEAQERVRGLIQHYQGTVFVVTHSLALLAMADVVWRFDHDHRVTVEAGRDYARPAFEQEGALW